MKTLLPGFLLLFFLATGDLLGQVKYEKEAASKWRRYPFWLSGFLKGSSESSFRLSLTW